MTPSKLPILGLTGNSGSGKNTVAELLQSEGGCCIDADILAHEAMRPGEPAHQEILALFGEAVLSGNAEIDRKKLGGIVFKDRDLLKNLENILHRQVIAKTWALTRAKRENPGGMRFIVWNAPLLIDADMHPHCDSVWLITARRDNKLARIQARDGVSREAAESRLNSQMPEEEIQARIQNALGHARLILIENNGDFRLLAGRVHEALRLLLDVCR